MTNYNTGKDLFIDDNSISGWIGLRYLEEWTDIAKSLDVATGYFEVQIALLSERITGLGQHFPSRASDNSSRRGLVKMVNQRRKLVDYLKANQPQKYQEVVERLGGRFGRALSAL